MEKTFVIGNKPRKRGFVVGIIISIILGYILSRVFSYIVEDRNMKFLITVGVILICLFSIIPAYIGSSIRWEIREGHFKYYEIRSYIDQLKYFFYGFCLEDKSKVLDIKLEDIESIKLYWNDYLDVLSSVGHEIFFGIKLKSGDLLSVEALLTSNNFKFIRAVNYLKEEYNIEIIDKYNLLEVLGDTSLNLVDYINDIEKRKRAYD
ncbi:hypothetical protein M4I33_05770 [Clostridium sp. LY3-2]|uniref:hypothetical protein n=1 Tax=Clostridium sp. LY3-2 TaxID=2942482 RepID=UPI002152C167|nr:hypothetical protein [Clostridium sp. LY3-2]MCR6514388.1 hypothetical protein [Clostridium sp. LY3-2]